MSSNFSEEARAKRMAAEEEARAKRIAAAEEARAKRMAAEEEARAKRIAAAEGSNVEYSVECSHTDCNNKYYTGKSEQLSKLPELPFMSKEKIKSYQSKLQETNEGWWECINYIVGTCIKWKLMENQDKGSIVFEGSINKSLCPIHNLEKKKKNLQIPDFDASLKLSAFAEQLAEAANKSKDGGNINTSKRKKNKRNTSRRKKNKRKTIKRKKNKRKTIKRKTSNIY
jgi:hypothetical protein